MELFIDLLDDSQWKRIQSIRENFYDKLEKMKTDRYEMSFSDAMNTYSEIWLKRFLSERKIIAEKYPQCIE